MAAGGALSAFLEALFQNLASPILERVASCWGINSELTRLGRTLTRIQAVLADAEGRQIRDSVVRIWLRDLKEVAYEADDLLDELATEGLRSKLETELSGNESTVTSIFSSLRSKISHLNFSQRIKGIRERLDEIAKESHDLGLKDRIGEREMISSAATYSECRQSTSCVKESCIYGREADKKYIIGLLLPSASGGKVDVDVIPIVGMGGLGKTTLAQLVYNDRSLQGHFSSKMWVSVSQDFDAVRITKAIIESITDKRCDLEFLDTMQRRLRELLVGKRYLLVLDDVWNESPMDWAMLRAPLLVGSRGSKIVVTTRSTKVGVIMGTAPCYSLSGLSELGCWSVFSQHAFDGWEARRPDLEAIGREIVSNCGGLPLAAKSLGCLLHSKKDESEWRTILNNEIWELDDDKDGILPALRLSYHHLPAHLKQCFTYCAIFPKTFTFERDYLVGLWIAQGFVQEKQGMRAEDTGNRYFHDLLQRSFFQPSLHTVGGGGQSKYTMHDLIHSLAQSTAGEECSMVEYGKLNNPSMGARHASISRCSSYAEAFEAVLHQSKGLRTFLLLGDDRGCIKGILKKMFNSLVCLRVLDLRHSQVSELPDSIGNLLHLRYLGLYGTPIIRLPESVSNLYNLQTLELGGCCMLQELPSGTRKLVNLRHLNLYVNHDLSDSSCGPMRSELTAMPPGIGQLTKLQTLSRFMVGTAKRHGSGIEELKNMVNLRGELCITNLENVTDSRDAEEANLMNKPYLSKLELGWVCSIRGGVPHADVFEKLQPHANLKELVVRGFDGLCFPSWTSEASYSNLSTIRLLNCRTCRLLPPLGELPALCNLMIGGLDAVDRVGREFCGNVGEPFPSLKVLRFCDMPNLVLWSDGEFPCLSELQVVNCPRLTQLPPRLHSLTKLEAIDCRELPPHHSALPHLQSLALFHCNTLHLYQSQMVAELLPRLTDLRIGSFPDLHSLPRGLLGLTALQDLEIEDCPELVMLPRMMVRLVSLERMEIWNCPKLRHLPDPGLPKSLQFLSINGCPLLKECCQDASSPEFGIISDILWLWIDGEPIRHHPRKGDNDDSGSSSTSRKGKRKCCKTEVITTTPGEFRERVQELTGLKIQTSPSTVTTERAQATATLISDIQEEDGRYALVLDTTIFGPGGQAVGKTSEMGYITMPDTDFKFIVEDVRIRDDGLALHYGHFADSQARGNFTLEIRQTVHLHVKRQT